MNETLDICENSVFLSYNQDKKCGKVEIISFFENYQIHGSEQKYTLILKFTPGEYGLSKIINKNHQMRIEIDQHNFFNFIRSLKCLDGKENTKNPKLFESKFNGVSKGKELDFTICIDQGFYIIPDNIKNILPNEAKFIF